MIRLKTDVELRTITFVEGAEQHTIVESPYGWTIYENGFAEWQLDVRHTHRQDGKTAWGVTMTDIDGKVRCIEGLTIYAEAAKAIFDVVRMMTGNWIDPIEGEVA